MPGVASEDGLARLLEVVWVMVAIPIIALNWRLCRNAAVGFWSHLHDRQMGADTQG